MLPFVPSSKVEYPSSPGGVNSLEGERLSGQNPPMASLRDLRYATSSGTLSGLMNGYSSNSSSVKDNPRSSRIHLMLSTSAFFLPCVVFLPANAGPRPYPLIVLARMIVGLSVHASAAAYAALIFTMSWPPRLAAKASKSSSLKCETIALSCGVLNNSLRKVAASLVKILCSSPSTNSCSLFARLPSESLANKSSHIEPHRILITFHPEPLNLPSSSCTIFELPRTGPSNL